MRQCILLTGTHQSPFLCRDSLEAISVATQRHALLFHVDICDSNPAPCFERALIEYAPASLEAESFYVMRAGVAPICDRKAAQVGAWGIHLGWAAGVTPRKLDGGSRCGLGETPAVGICVVLDVYASKTCA